jgi:hypothetical protein
MPNIRLINILSETKKKIRLKMSCKIYFYHYETKSVSTYSFSQFDVRASFCVTVVSPEFYVALLLNHKVVMLKITAEKNINECMNK